MGTLFRISEQFGEESRRQAKSIADRQVEIASWSRPGHFRRALSDPWYVLLAQMQSNFFSATVDFYRGRQIHTLLLPMTTGSVSSPMGLGSDSTPVQIKIWDTETYLSDSMQFFLEYACRLFPCGSYSLLPSFRGESPDTSHLSQFYQSEVEIPGYFCDAVTLAEEYVRYVCRHLFANCEDSIANLDIDVSHVSKLSESTKPLPQITLDEAHTMLGDEYIETDATHRFRSLTRKGERTLIREFSGPVWLTKLDHLAVPFYQGFADDGLKSAAAADLLMGIGETIGLGERHATTTQLRRALDLHQIEPKEYSWYLELRKFSPMVTSGYGLGVERFFCWVLNCTDIRSCQIFPRMRGVNPEV